MKNSTKELKLSNKFTVKMKKRTKQDKNFKRATEKSEM